MQQLLEQLENNDWTTLVSLPQNNLEFAQAALRGGAGGLKVHLNVEHFASGTRFGSWEEEKDVLEQIVSLAREYDANVGIVPGANGKFAEPHEFAQLAQIGIDYFDAYPFDCPGWALVQRDLDVMIAAHHGYDLAVFAELEGMGMTLCEASLLSHDDYGLPLMVSDLAKYAALCNQLDSPVVIPSQRKLEPRDLPALRSTGASAVLIGAIVTGRDAKSIEAATRAFVQAAQD